MAKAHVSKRLEILKVRWAGIKNQQISKEHFGAVFLLLHVNLTRTHWSSQGPKKTHEILSIVIIPGRYIIKEDNGRYIIKI